jgi:hypothetical protein
MLARRRIVAVLTTLGALRAVAGCAEHRCLFGDTSCPPLITSTPLPPPPDPPFGDASAPPPDADGRNDDAGDDGDAHDDDATVGDAPDA